MNSGMRNNAILATLIFCQLFHEASRAENVDEQIRVLLHVVSYQMGTLEYPEYTIVVVYSPSLASDKVTSIMNGFEKNRGLKVLGKKLSLKEIPFVSEDELKAKLVDVKASAVYLAAGFEDTNAVKILGVTRQLKILSIAGDPQYIKKAGATLGVSNVAGKYKILINRKGSMLEGVKFDTRLLRMAVY